MLETGTEDICFLPSTYQSDRTSSPSSLSSSSSEGLRMTTDNNFFNGWNSSQGMDFQLQPDLEMDIFGPSDERIDLDLELDPFGKAVADLELQNDPNSSELDMLLRQGGQSLELFQLEFGTNSLSGPSSPLLLYSENSNASSSGCSSDATGCGSINGFMIDPKDLIQVNVNMETYSPSPSMDSPPLTPPEVKVDLRKTNSANIISDLPKMLPVLKSSKRGRSASHDDSPDVQALKRHIRMIRNRESASLSRKKKKDYVTGLESRIKELETEVQELKKENATLRSKLTPSQLQQLPKKTKGHVGVMAKVALMGFFGFLMVNFHGPAFTRTHHGLEEHSNLTEQFHSRTFSNLRREEIHVDEEIPPLPLLARGKRIVQRENEALILNSITSLNYTSTSLLHDESSTAATALGGNYTDIQRKATAVNNSSYSDSFSNITEHVVKDAKPTSYLNGTIYNSTKVQPDSVKNNKNTRGANGTKSYRWRSRGLKAGKKSKNWSLSSSNWVFPPFMGSAAGGNGTNSASDSDKKCSNYFNKTESMRVKSDLEDIFGRGRFTEKKRKGPQIRFKGEPTPPKPIVYSLTSQNNRGNELMAAESQGLTIYNAEKKRRNSKYSNILEKLERREDTFYVVSLASENQLLLSAKASNESSRPKMTLLLPWKNETLNQEMILQIDCEVFQVFNLNEKKGHRG